MPDIKGLPYPNASAIPDGPGAFLALNSVLAGGQVFRRFATWTAMDGVADAVTHELAIVDAVPGAWFKYDGAEWVMNGTAQFADATARDAALPTPAAGMLAVATGITYRYSGSAWLWSPQIVEQGVASGSADSAASGVTVIAKTFAAQPNPTEVAAQITGQGGFNAATITVSIDLSISAGTMVDPGYGQSVQAVNGTFTTVARTIRFTIPANTASTLTIMGNSSANGTYWRLMCNYQRFV